MRFLSILVLVALISSSYAQTEVSFTTYNLGLAHTFIPYAKERVEPLAKALNEHDSDVVCLQEVWKKKDQRKIVKALKGNFPFSFVEKTKKFRQGSKPTCKVSEIFGEGKFVSCMQNQCGGLDGDKFTDCIINKCGTALQNLKTENRTCASALMAQVGKNPIISMLTLINPLWRAGQFAYKGSNGLMLFSKYPIKETRYIDLKSISTLNRRGALQAVVDIKGKDVQVLCTHISADLSKTVPYTGSFSSWGEENGSQLEWLLQITNQKLLPTVFLGDFNCGEEDLASGITGELASNCQMVTDWGFSDPLATDTRECTFCQDNLLNEGESESFAIDHIFLKGLEFQSGKVTFKEKITVKPKREDKLKTQLSDHYGYQVKAILP